MLTALVKDAHGNLARMQLRLRDAMIYDRTSGIGHMRRSDG
jgi:hypothetical protein